MEIRIVDDHSSQELNKIADTNYSLLSNPVLADLKSELLRQLITKPEVDKLSQFLPQLNKEQLALLLGSEQMALTYLIYTLRWQIKKIIFFYLTTGLSTISLFTLVSILIELQNIICAFSPVLGTAFFIAGAAHTGLKCRNFLGKGCEYQDFNRPSELVFSSDPTASTRAAVKAICQELADALEPKILTINNCAATNQGHDGSVNFYLIHGMEQAISTRHSAPKTKICTELQIKKSNLVRVHRAIAQILRQHFESISGTNNLVLISE